MKKSHLILLLIMLATFGGRLLQAQTQAEESEKVVKLMEEIFQQIPVDLSEIDSKLKRIAVYRIKTDSKYIPAPLREHFENRLVELLRSLGTPSVVALPELNRLKITANDTSFSIINALPSPDELWLVGRKLRVDGFLEGNLVYVPGKALFLDLRLNRTGTNEVLWAKSYSAYQQDMRLPSLNPLYKSLNAGMEIFQMEFDPAADSLRHPDFSNRLTNYTIYLGVYQYLTPKSRLRYELRFGLSFLTGGVKLRDTRFVGRSFYANSSNGLRLAEPNSFNIRSLLFSTIAENTNNPAGDWLSVYFALTRYFAVKMPDFTGIGLGLRTDINSHFSISTGISVIFGSEFDSREVMATGESVRLRVNGLHYEFLFLNYTL
ncbi:MAG: hypothetical protein ACE5HS_06965 [bacterium]